MFDQNDGRNPDNIAQNRFTAYLLVAFRNTRKLYMDKQKSIKCHEIPLEICDGDTRFIYVPDMLDTLPVLDQIENPALQTCLLDTRERDLEIFIGKIIEGKSLRQLSDEVGIGLSTVSSIYRRLLKRLRRELENHGDGL